MAKWVDRYWNSKDGLRLHYRDYAGPAERPPILCLPGLPATLAISSRSPIAWPGSGG